jgi:hypothetical protein
MSHPHHKITLPTPPRIGSDLAQHKPPGVSFQLDETAPAKAVKHINSAESPISAVSNRTNLDSVTEEPEKEVGASDTAVEQPPGGEDLAEEALGWGQNFKVEWISTERLPFYRTRHLRNPWNHDREVKVSRDGTELEPSVGQALIDEWAKLAEPQQAEGDGASGTTQTTAGAGGGSSKRATSSKFRADGQPSRS